MRTKETMEAAPTCDNQTRKPWQPTAREDRERRTVQRTIMGVAIVIIILHSI